MKFVDLFCGCGGLSLGLEKAGMKPIVSIDNLKEINLIHKKNFKHDFIECDLNDVKKTTNIFFLEIWNGLRYEEYVVKRYICLTFQDLRLQGQG